MRRGEQGLLVPPKDVNALTEALAKLLDEPSYERGWGRRGRERAEQFSWPNITAKVEDYYKFVIRRVAAQGPLPEHVHRAVLAEVARTAPAVPLWTCRCRRLRKTSSPSLPNRMPWLPAAITCARPTRPPGLYPRAQCPLSEHEPKTCWLGWR